MWLRGDGGLDTDIGGQVRLALETRSARSLAEDRAARSAKGRLAAIIVLDPFTCNILGKPLRPRAGQSGAPLVQGMPAVPVVDLFTPPASTGTARLRSVREIHQYGRLPHRNTPVSCTSTPEEPEWLAEGGRFQALAVRAPCRSRAAQPPAQTGAAPFVPARRASGDSPAPVVLQTHRELPEADQR